MSTLRTHADGGLRATVTARTHLSLVVAPPAPRPAPKLCLNCHEPLGGRFCQGCGQAAKTKRFDIKALLHQIPHEIWHLDHALPHTLKALATKPGHTIRRYLAGERAHVYSPLSLLFMVGAVLLFAQGALHVTMQLSFAGTATFLTKYQTWIEIFYAPVNAAAPYFLLRKRTGLTYGEQVMAAVMAAVGTIAVSLAFVPLLWLAKSARAHDAVVGLTMLATFAYTLWLYAQLQDDGTKDDAGARWTRSLGATFGTLGVYGLVIAAQFVAIIVIVGDATLTAWLVQKASRAVGIHGAISPKAVLWTGGDLLERLGLMSQH